MTMNISRLFVLAVAISLASAACAGEGNATEAPAAEGCVTGIENDETVTFTAEDGTSLVGIISRPEASVDCSPGVVFVHGFGSTKEQWEDHLDAFTGQGYVTLAIDLRSHGQSDSATVGRTSLLSDPTQAPLDVQAAVQFLAADSQVDPDRIAVVGTSVGANLAVVAHSLEPSVKVTVPVSARFMRVDELLGGETLSVRSVLCFAGADDFDGDQADACMELEQIATGTSESVIIANSRAHGREIVDMSTTVPHILRFLEANL